DPGNPAGAIDPDQSAALPEYKATISWGPAGPTTTLDSFNDPSAFVFARGGTFRVLASPAAAEEGTYGVTLQVAHDAVPAKPAVVTLTLTVAEVAVAAAASQPSLAAVPEGATLAAVPLVAFVDPARAEPNASDPGGLAGHYQVVSID